MAAGAAKGPLTRGIHKLPVSGYNGPGDSPHHIRTSARCTGKVRIDQPRTLQLMLLTLLCVSWTWAADGIEVTVVTDRPDAVYACGAEARFLVTVKENGELVTSGQFTYTLTLDGAHKFAEGVGELGPTATTVLGSLDSPGILRCTVTYPGPEEPIIARGAAAFCPLGIAPTATEPDDFLRFWDFNKRKLRRVPMDVQLTKSMAHSTPGMSVFKISLANILGTRVYGWLGVPHARGPHPAMLTIPAAGVGPTPPGLVNWAERGFLAMAVSVHDYDVDLTEEEYEELEETVLADYPRRFPESRRTYYFLRTILGIQRSLDFLTSVPYVDNDGRRHAWDGRNLVVIGSSQGGGLALIAAGLDDRVSAVAANVPALCDHTGKFHDRPSGWPRLIPDDDPVVTDVAGYFDAVNFARYIKRPALVAVGLVDTSCPPTTVLSAFNAIPGDKELMSLPAPVPDRWGDHSYIISSPRMGHAQDPDYVRLRDEWIMQQAFGKIVRQEIRMRGR